MCRVESLRSRRIDGINKYEKIDDDNEDNDNGRKEKKQKTYDYTPDFNVQLEV